MVLQSVVRARVNAECATERAAAALRNAERATRIARQEAASFGALHPWCMAQAAKEPETPKMREYRIAVMTKAFGH
jgi:hypothetical protein